VINAAKGVIDETFPHCLGIYNGKASEPHVRDSIETSDRGDHGQLLGLAARRAGVKEGPPIGRRLCPERSRSVSETAEQGCGRLVAEDGFVPPTHGLKFRCSKSLIFCFY
jgi:hypothetical protein